MGQTTLGDSGDYDYDGDWIAENVSENFDSLDSARDTAIEVLKVLATETIDVTVANQERFNQYILCVVDAEGHEPDQVRPINTNLFISDVDEFRSSARRLNGFLKRLAENERVSDSLEEEYPDFVSGNLLNEVLYTLSQSVGIGCDIFLSPNTARRNAGLRFESVVEEVMTNLGFAHDNISFRIPVENTEDEWTCRSDMVFGTNDQVESTRETVDEKEVVTSIKTSSKDRATKIFTDKWIMSKILGREIPHVALFLNDVQRKGDSGIDSTFVSNNYYIYSEYMTALEGTYFLDPPDKIDEEGFNDKLDTFREFILEDAWELTESD